MKKQAFYRIAVLSLVLLAGALSGRAQSRPGELMVKVPFDFNVGERKLPAGDYVIKRGSTDPRLLTIQRTDYRVAAVVYAPMLETPPRQMKSYLVFNVYRGQRFLARVHSGNGNFRHEVAKTRSERKLIRIAKATAQ